MHSPHCSRSFPASLAVLILALVLNLAFPEGLAVRAAEPKRDWRIYSTSHFELLTDGTDRAAEAALERLERYRAAAGRMQGDNLLSRLPVRIYLVLSSDEFTWMRSVASTARGTVGIYQSTPVDHLLAVSTVDDKESEGRVVLHEYTHLLLHGFQRDWPFWLHEGFAQALETVELRDDRAIFGKPMPFGSLYLKRRGFRPLPELFAFKTRSTNAVSSEELTQVYIESWAVCHYLYFGIPQAQDQAALQFINDVGRGKPVDAALKERLNLTPDQLQAAVVEHVHHGRSRTAGYRLPDDVQKLPAPRERRAGPGEVEAWLGDWAIGQDPAQAEARYQRSLQEAPGNVFGLTGLGRCQALQEKFPEALETLRKATQADPNSGWAWLYLARIGSDSTEDDAGEKDGPRALPSDTLDAARRAQTLLPQHPGPFREEGRALALSGGKAQAVVDAFGKAATRDPANLFIPIEAAVHLANLGQRNAAVQMLDSVIQRNGDGVAGQFAQALRDAIRSNSNDPGRAQSVLKAETSE